MNENKNISIKLIIKEINNINNYKFTKPSPILCTDNAAMIGCAGYYKYLKQQFDNSSLNAMPNLQLAK